MTKIKALLTNIIILLVNVTVFSYKIFRQLVLPNKKRKGNILSSIFIFIMGILAELSIFEKKVLDSRWLRHRYLKQGLILLASLLFFISSFEWSVGAHKLKVAIQADSFQSEQNHSSAAIVYKRKTSLPASVVIQTSLVYCNSEKFCLSNQIQTPQSRRYLYCCSFLI